MRRISSLMAAGAALGLATCLAAGLATAAEAGTAPSAGHDPWEGMNRGFYGLNKGLDRAVVRPAAMGYRRALPKEVRLGVHNVLSNLGEPLVSLNHVLQLRPEPAARSAGRFAINTTVGVLGIMDVASASGVPQEDTDFGLTLARWGAPAGPYLYLPLVGPATVRDAAGKLVDGFISPLEWARYDGRLAVNASLAVANGLDQRVEIEPVYRDLQQNALDPYATLRSAYLQNRAAAVRGQVREDVDSLPDLDAGAAPAAKPAVEPKATAKPPAGADKPPTSPH